MCVCCHVQIRVYALSRNTQCTLPSQLFTLSATPTHYENVLQLYQLQVVLVSGYLLHGSVYTLLCWVTVLPLLISYSRAADANMKTMAVTVPQHLRVPLVVACLGLCK